MHENGLGIERDYRTAYNYFKKAARMNHAEAISKCGDYLYSGRLSNGVSNRTEALKCYQKASDMNSAVATNNLALMIESSDPKKALELFKQAHKLGNLDATVNLAYGYFNVRQLLLSALDE
jgi:TPR repeat protein